MVREVTGADDVEHGQRAGALPAGQGGEVGVAVKHAAKQMPDLTVWRAVFQARAQPNEVDEDRLAIAPVGAIAGMLGHVGIDDKPTSGRKSEPLHLIRLHLHERVPAAGGTCNVRMDGGVEIREQASAPIAGRRSAG